MREVRIFNTLGREKQVFSSRVPGQVSVYSCGPTVYKFAHIGNFRTYLMTDLWVRALEYLGHRVTLVQNITDVGHLVRDEVGAGEDKIELAARQESRTPGEIAEFYIDAFNHDAALLNIRPADAYPRATEFIPQMLEVIGRLEKLGLTYTVDGNVYYDVARRHPYPVLSNRTLDQVQAVHRVEPDPRKRNPADFALWKAAGGERMQVWDSPWGPGFPGWHIECSAMSLHHFPGGFDIHTGGVDLVFPHHEDEIAQSEPLLEGRVANYWVHGEFLELDGAKMSKSAGQVIRVADLEADGFDPLAFRFLVLGARYRQRLSFSADILTAAAHGLQAVRSRSRNWPAGVPLSTAEGLGFEEQFKDALADDLDLPRVTSMVAAVTRSSIPDGEKATLLENWDTVLQVGLTRAPESAPEQQAPAEVQALAERRALARTNKDWAEADRIRGELGSAGWLIEDLPTGFRLHRA